MSLIPRKPNRFNKNFYFNVLKTLSKAGLNTPCDISNLTKIYFSNQSGIDLVWSNVDDAINQYFKPMINDGYITDYTNNTPKNLSFDTERKYILCISVSASITNKGLEFYNRNHKKWWEIWSFWVTVISVVIAAITAWLTYINVFSKDNAKPETKQSPHNKQQPASHSSQSPKASVPKALPADSSRKH